MKDSFINRKYFIIVVIALISIMLLSRLFYIQVIDNSYRTSADNNVLRYVTQYPARGLIYDRNGKMLVSNQAVYDLMVIPGQTGKMDTAEFCNILEITNKSFNERMIAARSYSKQAPSVFLKQISSETYGRLQEKMFMYTGFYVQSRTLRKYTKPLASHILGYVGEVDDEIIINDPYYKSGDYIGISGIEKAYEKELRGKKGSKIFLVDVYSRIKGAYRNGDLDTIAIKGKDLTSSIDIDLQEYGELLMQNKTGSIVAIEPTTGEILALVSAPGYDPGLLVGRIRSDNFNKLQNDTLEPLFNRALMASYPPGSTFKPVNGLIALQEKVIDHGTQFSCNGEYLIVGCHLHRSPLNLEDAIMISCNSYFCQAFRRTLENSADSSVAEAFDKWHRYLAEFGFGSTLGTDFVNELPGFIPTISYYDKYYGENKWKALNVISLAIGQGEIGTTPLQMANYTAAIANRGYFYTPHIVKSIGDGEQIDARFSEKHLINIDKENFETIILGMEKAVNGSEGTARSVAVNDIVICGKTGTAQNPQGDDHSVFIAFAPKDDPKIAIAVYVENAGFGSTLAAPVASLMIEKYLKGEISNKWLEQNMLNLNLIKK
jgi:penicillin-binding protein 2